MAASALGITVFCTVLGSSSVPGLVGPGRNLRWLSLLALAAIALVLAFRGRRARPGGPLLRMVAVGAWLVAVAALSTAWSVDQRLTFGRAGSLALLFVAAAALAFSARSRPLLPGRLLAGVLGAAVAAALGGLLLLAVRHGDAVQAATGASPARLRGLGENPDTLAMLYGLAVPIALFALGRARSNVGRLLALAAALLLVGSISASGSRGGLLAALVGGIAYALTTPAPIRRRLALALAVSVAMVAATAGTRIPKPLPVPPPSAHPAKPGQKPLPVQPGQAVGAPEPQYAGRLEDELYRIYPGARSLFTSSGRIQAWYTAIQQGDARPLLGYGFGTENEVFVDRVYNFQGSYVENSLIGLYLQLGVVGLLSLAALVLTPCLVLVRGLRRRAAPDSTPPLAGVVAAGLALMLVQSYVYSVGNVATASFWIASFAVAGVAFAGEPIAALPREQGGVLASA